MLRFQLLFFWDNKGSFSLSLKVLLSEYSTDLKGLLSEYSVIGTTDLFSFDVGKYSLILGITRLSNLLLNVILSHLSLGFY